MASDLPLWSAPLQKEAFDILVALWPQLDIEDRTALVEEILKGPPLEGSRKAPAELERIRDREIFERLELLHRLREPPLPAAGATRLAALRRAYPEWRLEEGERAHFTSWMESASWRPSDFGVSDLLARSNDELIRILSEHAHDREGLLDTWYALCEANPYRAADVLTAMAADGRGAPDVWATTFRGLRRKLEAPEIARQVLSALAAAPERVFAERDVTSAAASFLAEVSKGPPPVDEAIFWRLWTSLVAGAAGQPMGVANDGDWVTAALNHPAGDLAHALLNRTFARQLRVGQGLPDDLRMYYERLVDPQPPALRLARVLFASRLTYLFAVDPTWTTEHLIPFFDWERSEDEALALWHGFAWHGRISPDLWPAIQGYFLDAFTPHRLERLGDSAGRLAALLMVVGIDLPQTGVPAERVRHALRTIPPDARHEALSWIWSRMAGSAPKDDAAAIAEQRHQADQLWRTRIEPWLRRVWPNERVYIEPGAAELFGRIATTTSEAFDEAVAFVRPYLCPIDDWGFVVTSLNESDHPERHPQSVLALISQLVSPDGPFFRDSIQAVLHRLRAVAPDLAQDPTYRKLDAANRTAFS